MNPARFFSRLRPKLTYANVMVTILAAVVLATGSAVAASGGGTKAIKKVVRTLAPGLSVSHASSADRAGSSDHAGTADHASTADHAGAADSASNADQLGGAAPSSIGGVLTDHSPDFSGVAASGSTNLPVTGDEAASGSPIVHGLPDLPLNARHIAVEAPPLNGASGPFRVNLVVIPPDRLSSTTHEICTITFPAQRCTFDGPISLPAGAFLYWQIDNTGPNSSTGTRFESSILLTSG